MMTRHTRQCLLALVVALAPCWVLAQATIDGTIVDVDGEPLIGVTIRVVNTGVGTVTDFNGAYELTVPALPATVSVSYIGYASKETVVDRAGRYDFTLTEDATKLDEVVVTGLASSVKRSNLANAVSTISGAQLAEVTTQSTVDGALYGKLTGVNIVSTGGAPGGGIALRLRGVSSLSGNNQPLFIVDGVYISNAEIPSGLRNASGANGASEEGASNRLADINPEDIQSIEVLKGASAAAIYGTRANAGVVIITTKRGKAGKTNITVNQDLGVNVIQRYVGRYNYSQADADVIGQGSQYRAAVDGGYLTDLEKEFYGEKGFISDSRVSVRGGGDKTTFYVNGSYRNEDGIVKGTGFERASIRLNLNHDISSKLSLTTSTNFVNSQAQRSFTGNENDGGLSYGYTLAYTPNWANLRPDANGNYPVNPYYAGNPYQTRDQAENNESNNRIIQGLGLTYRVITADNHTLKLVGNGGIDFLASQTDVYVPETFQSQVGRDNGFISKGRNKLFQGNYNALGVFNYYAENDLSFETQAGVSYLRFDNDFVRSTVTQLVPEQRTLDQGGAQSIDQTVSTVEEFGYIAQQSVNYQDKIILTGGVRLDKSTLNGDPNKLFAFPRASLAVNLANFGTMSDGPFDVLKLRGAFGQTGNSAAFGRLFTPLTPTNIGGQLGFTVLGRQGNADLEPERSTELEVGVDMFLLDSRLGLEVTYYDRKVSDLLYDRTAPASSGFTNEIRNDLDLVNRGLEVALNVTPVRTTNFNYSTTVNVWFNRSKVTRLGLPGGRNAEGNFAPGDIPSFTPPAVAFGLGLGTFFVDEGSPITAFFGRNPVAGGPPVIIGNSEPKFQLGWSNQFTIGERFDLSFLFHLKQGGDALNLTRLLTDDLTSPDLPPPGPAREAFSRPTYIEDASYFRLREIGAYYRIPITNEVVRGIKVGVSGRNVFTLTDYSGYDPEISAFGGSGLSNSIDVAPFPSSRQFYGHLAFTF